jgi:quercetin dioxygenase-like cupin family protein
MAAGSSVTTSDSPGKPGETIDFRSLAAGHADARPAWSARTADLNLNLTVLGPAGRIEDHVNTEVDVLLLALEGEGAVMVDGSEQRVTSGQGIVILKGARRSIRCTAERFVYLVCHRRRGGLWPAGPVKRD